MRDKRREREREEKKKITFRLRKKIGEISTACSPGHIPEPKRGTSKQNKQAANTVLHLWYSFLSAAQG